MASVCTNGVDTGFVALGTGKVAVLGVVQGITELLPISSTAHMRLVPAVLGWPDPGSAFSAAMQLAALFAVVTYFWSDLRALACGSISAVRAGDFTAHAPKTVLGIILGTIPIVIAGVLLKSKLNACGSSFRELWVIGAASLVMGLLLGIAEMTSRHTRTFAQIKLPDALVVGLAQVGALIPGVSRSGSTLTAAMFLGLRREDAARFSFLLGLPAIFAAGVKELLELHHAGLDMQGWEVLGVGLLTASLSAFVAIWTLMRVMERLSSWPFVFYRIGMGVFLLVAVWRGVLS
ncbi:MULTISPECIES: undecaprenyl-diphosphatase UppP [Xanthobacter]|uniref:Undecaprenyl-diphosphatase n=1 Tax=Xanthobacter aminoxidans TaxID=186280 RepID=A0ABW6ZF54_9HYPH|nr:MULTISPECIES: undecaprenyl-diphosphatase UppP [Xanthobacter]MCL8382683.1 undecaprenyl-diphosphatase UppP [Xanthobacter aminoxidans]